MISVIIPTLNEAAHLPSALERIASFKASHEVLVVDAGSSDGTFEIARQFGAQVIPSPIRQRAAQLNLGAKHARRDILLFLHADTILPQRAFERISEAMEKQGVVGGAFRRYFLSDSLFLQVTCRIAAFRNFALGWHLGDQAMFVSTAAFQKLEGFKEMDRFEDLDFSRRLKRLGKLKTISNPVLTSARRFEKQGPITTTARDFWQTIRYLCGDQSVTQKNASLPRSADIPVRKT